MTTERWCGQGHDPVAWYSASRYCWFCGKRGRSDMDRYWMQVIARM